MIASQNAGEWLQKTFEPARLRQAIEEVVLSRKRTEEQRFIAPIGVAPNATQNDFWVTLDQLDSVNAKSGCSPAPTIECLVALRLPAHVQLQRAFQEHLDAEL